MKMIFANALTLLVALVVGLGILEFGTRFFMPGWSEFSADRFMISEIVPGYGKTTIGRRGFDGYFAQNNGDFRIRIQINDFGLRDRRPVQSADGQVWVVGDSFSFGWGVGSQETYSAVTQRLSGMGTYNMSNPGTSVCGYQASIARVSPDILPLALIVGLTLENDISEKDCRVQAEAQAQRPKAGPGEGLNILQFKAWLTLNSALYNAFTVTVKRLPSFLRIFKAIGLIAQEHTRKYSIDEDRITPAVQKTAQNLKRLQGLLPEGTPFAVLLIPGRTEIRDNDPYYRRIRNEVRQALTAQNITFIDPFDAFKAAGFDKVFFRHDGHWSADGHSIAGEAAAGWAKETLALQ